MILWSTASDMNITDGSILSCSFIFLFTSAQDYFHLNLKRKNVSSKSSDGSRVEMYAEKRQDKERGMSGNCDRSDERRMFQRSL